MAASLYLTSDTVRAIAVPVETVICFTPEDGMTKLLTTGGTVRVLEDVDTITRLLGERPWVRPGFESHS